MADPQSMPPQPPQSTQPPQSPAPPSQSPMNSMMSSMSQWEMFILAGALALIIGDLVFGILLREVYAGDLIWLGAAIAALAYFANRRAPGSVPMYRNVMLLSAAVVALVGVRDVVIEVYFILRNLNDLTDEPAYLLGVLIWIVGIALVAWGGWLLWRNRAAT